MSRNLQLQRAVPRVRTLSRCRWRALPRLRLARGALAAPSLGAQRHPLSANMFRRKEGQLEKRGGLIKSWHARWCALDDTRGPALRYYARVGDRVPRGVVLLAGATVRAAGAAE